MRLEIQTSELTRALYRAQGIADKKSAMPSLSHVLLSTHAADGVTVSATDNDIYLTGQYAAQAAQPGRLAVHARQFYDIVRAVSGETVILSRQENHWVDIQSGNSHFHLVGMVADDFPEFPANPAAGSQLSVAAGTLARMVERTLFCVSTDENRHHLSGIFMETPAAGSLRMVATDGHRLALAEGALLGEGRLEQGVIVPRKGLHELKRLLGDGAKGDDTVHLALSGNSCVVRFGSAQLSMRLIEGQFPAYAQVIPEGATKEATLERAAFAEVLRRVSLMAHGRAHGVRFEFGPGSLKLVAEDPQMGSAEEHMAIDYRGEPLAIGFNARYLLDALALVAEPRVRFELCDDLSPGVLRPLEDGKFLAVVMPMRI